jgi:DNA-binding LacI/PurR family transcriptional regulator
MSAASHHHATISDVARLSGVTKATVSKALDPAGRYGINPQTRQRVIEAAKQLGYEPGARQRGLAGGGKVVALACPPRAELLEDVERRVVRSLTSALTDRGFHLIQLTLTGDAAHWPRLLLDRRVRGFVLTSVGRVDVSRMVEAMSPVPCIILNAVPAAAVSQIVIDHESGAMLLGAHLLERGHGGVMLWKSATTESNALRRAGLEGLAVDENDAQTLLERWSSQRGQPRRYSAIVCGTVSLATELLQACWRAGITVPDQLSVAALEDAYPAAALIPPLTAVRAPLEQLGHEAATLLVEQIQSRQSPLPRKIVLRPTLVIRQSTGAAAG